MKKIVLLAVAVAVMGISSALNAGCSACAANAVIKEAYAKSVAAAQAAAIADKPNAKPGKPSREGELDEVPAAARAPREPMFDPCNTLPHDHDNPCSIDAKLQALFNCCVFANQQLKEQRREAKKCCKKLRHEIEEVEELVVENSSVIEALIVSQIDEAALCCSLLDTLIVSQIDQAALCCSTTEGQITNLSSSVSDLSVSLSTQISALDLSIAAVLAVVLNIFACTCT